MTLRILKKGGVVDCSGVFFIMVSSKKKKKKNTVFGGNNLTARIYIKLICYWKQQKFQGRKDQR